MNISLAQMLLASALLVLASSVWGAAGWAQDSGRRSPPAAKETVDKSGGTPATASKTVETQADMVKGNVRKDSVSNKVSETKAAKQGPEGSVERAGASTRESASPQITRDPFRPMTLRTKTPPRSTENLSPLERLDLGQLKVVGIIWDIKEPRAMVEDTAKLGYTVKVGTPIGINEGKVKSIRQREVIVEEFYEDASGDRKKRDVSMRLSTE